MKLRHSILAISCAALWACTAAEQSLPAPEYTSPDYTNAVLDLSSPDAAAYSIMVAMYNGDADMLGEIFVDGATLRRVKADGSVSPDGLARWRDWVGTLNTGQAHEELFGIQVAQFENMASVIAPFVISVNDKIVGCGVNQLSMARIDGHWRVVSAMDTPAPKDQDCATFKDSYLKTD